MKWYKRDPGAWLVGVNSLRPEERGIYDTIIEVLYDRDGAAPPATDTEFWSRACYCDPRTWRRILAILVQKGKVTLSTSGEVEAKRVRSELEDAAKRIERSRELRQIQLKNQRPAPAEPPGQPHLQPDIQRKKESCPSKRTDHAYTDDFEEFWKPYPRTPNMSKYEAFKQWRKLSDQDRSLATAAVPRYGEFLRKPNAPEAIHACRFLSKRRFDGFMHPCEHDAPALVHGARPDGKFQAAPGSREMEAWNRYELETRGSVGPRGNRHGWVFESQWPPGHEGVA